MPFKSEAQRRYLWAKHPKIANRWSHKYGSKPQDMKEVRRNRLSKKRRKRNA